MNVSTTFAKKDLGVWISEDMKCSKQCLYACNKATKVLGMIKRTIRFKDTRVMLSLYKTLVVTSNIALVPGARIIRKTGSLLRKSRGDLQR